MFFFHENKLWTNKKITTTLITIILFMGSLPFILNQPLEYFKSYIFFTVAPKDVSFKIVPQPSINSFYLLSSADLFAETIIGWFKNPSFMDVIESKSISPLPTINVRKETKQNVMVFFTTDQKEKNTSLQEATLTTIQKFIDAYNKETNTVYTITNLGIHVDTLPSQRTIEVCISLMMSYLLAIFLSFAPSILKKR